MRAPSVVCCLLLADSPLSALFRCPLSSTASGVIILAAATAVTSPCGRGKGDAKSHRKVKSCNFRVGRSTESYHLGCGKGSAKSHRKVKSHISWAGNQRSPTISLTAKVVNVKDTHSSWAERSLSALDSCERLKPEPESRERVGIGS